ncbi:hypothetical protein T06_3592, partial [Trichinella sp. T6]
MSSTGRIFSCFKGGVNDLLDFFDFCIVSALHGNFSNGFDFAVSTIGD